MAAAPEHQVIVIGAGHCGVATSLALRKRGVDPLVLDDSERPGSAWLGRYEGLRLNTPKGLTKLARRRFARGTPRFPSREQMAENIARHAREAELEIRHGVHVERIDRDGEAWALSTSEGPLRSSQVVIATGFDREPLVPDWPGRDQFGGTLIHSAEYRSPAPFAGRSVLVVGPGSSGMEIAYYLTQGGAAKVWLAVRTPPNITPRVGRGGIAGDSVGIVMMRLPDWVGDWVAKAGRRVEFGDLAPYGLPTPAEGVMTRLRRTGLGPTITDREVIDAIKTGEIEVVSAVQRLDETGVSLADGSRLEPDAVICATGYRHGLEPLVGHLRVLDERGRPLATGEDAPAPGLRFIGFVPRPAGLGYASRQAARAAKAIARELNSDK